MQKVLVIVGPTASGKSALAVSLAKRFDGEIISADSRQVYRGLDIGTGKVTKKEMQGVPHHLLDVASPRKNLSAGDFERRARTTLENMSAKHKLPVVAGGTGFYIDALLGRMQLPDVRPNAALRARLQKKTAAQLYALLKKKAPRRAKQMNTPSERNNKVRLIRALEIAASKNPERSRTHPYDTFWIGVAPKQRELEKRIRARLKARVRGGMIAEAKRLHGEGLSFKRMNELGLEYRALSRLLQNKISKKEFEEELFRDIRRYAKKQFAYWKRNTDIRWYGPKQKAKITRDVAAWLRMR